MERVKIQVVEAGDYQISGTYQNTYVVAGTEGVVMAIDPGARCTLLKLDDGREVWVSWGEYALAD